MADFQQNVVPTFTRLPDEDLARMEKSIVRAARRAPIGVIIPALFSDLSSPAMQNIITELAGMNFVKRVYISLDKGTEERNSSRRGKSSSRWATKACCSGTIRPPCRR
jgi:glucosyl-3-phosphoglycerate synthase